MKNANKIINNVSFSLNDTIIIKIISIRCNIASMTISPHYINVQYIYTSSHILSGTFEMIFLSASLS